MAYAYVTLNHIELKTVRKRQKREAASTGYCRCAYFGLRLADEHGAGLTWCEAQLEHALTLESCFALSQSEGHWDSGEGMCGSLGGFFAAPHTTEARNGIANSFVSLSEHKVFLIVS